MASMRELHSLHKIVLIPYHRGISYIKNILFPSDTIVWQVFINNTGYIG